MEFFEVVTEAIVGNFFLTCLVLSLIAGWVAVSRLPKPREAGAAAERMIAWYCFFAIGVSLTLNFIFHAFFGQQTAEIIGWADSPFQFEVAVASLGFAVVGFLAFKWKDYALRVAAIIGPGIFTLGAAVGHVYQMVTEKNFAPGNAGVVFFTDIIIPLWGFALLLRYRREMRETQDA